VRWGTVCESAYDQDVTLRPPQERCMSAGKPDSWTPARRVTTAGTATPGGSNSTLPHSPTGSGHGCATSCGSE
jgi:hypothetical protein